ncbi:YhgE/Pip domain-containing protein [Gryllotalpicola ginsengisoli]|uniref:YhgE/Pip domain-containing protein n=1 Tax=Gryllotalpicola ginsengisoli TaxID=444608 RepID=UPI0003B36906|nr:YhgE/Pip domain-containing protein [Gryllotalpicola ginsengisoli]
MSTPSNETRKRNRAVRIAIAAIACIPLIYGGALIWANQDPTHRLDQVPAAVVDLDKPVTSDGKTVAVGREVTKNLLADDSSQNFDWVETDASTARSGLKDGTYLAVLTLPRTMSADAVSTGGDEPMAAKASAVTITTNDADNYIVGTISKSVGTAITESASAEVSRDYLEQVYLGITDLHDQLDEAADGAEKVSDGASDVEDGADSLASGSAQSASGAKQLASGLSTLAQGASSLADGTQQVASGADTLSQGASQLASGADTLSSGLTQLQQKTSSLPDDTATLNQGAQQLADGLSDAKSGYTTGVDQLADACAQIQADPVLKLDPVGQQLCAGIDQVAGAKNADGQYANSAAVRAGAAAVADGTQTLADQAPTLSSGIAQAASGAQTLDGKLQDAASGAKTLASGAEQSAQGAAQLDSAAAQASAGASDLASGTAQLASGASKLDSGAGTLASGAKTLTSKLTDGAAQVPTYTTAERAHLAKVAAQPVAFKQTHLNAVPSYGYGLAPYFMALGMWVGGLSIYMLLRAIPHRALERGRPGWFSAVLGYLRGAGVSIAQAAGMYLIVTLAIGVHPDHPAGLALFLGLAGLAFTAVNHALMVLFGSRGRFLGLLLVVLQLSAAGATYPIQTTPRFFQVIHGALPLTYAVNAIRSLIAGGTAGVPQGVAVLVCWLFGALAVSVGVTAWRRARKQEILLPDFAV